MRPPTRKELVDLIGFKRAKSCRNCAYRTANVCTLEVEPFGMFQIVQGVDKHLCDRWVEQTRP